jgi:hypothetical protein
MKERTEDARSEGGENTNDESEFEEYHRRIGVIYLAADQTPYRICKQIWALRKVPPTEVEFVETASPASWDWILAMTKPKRSLPRTIGDDVNRDYNRSH